MNKTLAAVVTYNRLDLLKQCLDKLLANDDIDIVVINNNSNDGTSLYLQQLSNINKQLNIINLDNNIGGAGGFNQALKYAIKYHYDFCWLMDDDTFVSKNSYQALKKASDLLDGNFGFLNSIVLYKDGSECKMNRFKIYKKFQIDSPLLQYGLIRVSQATFVSFFVNINAVKQVGYPIKEYFIWGDDMEYSLRLSKRYPCYAVGKSMVVHYTKNNVGSSIALDQGRLNQYYLAFRNDFATAKKNGFKAICYYLGKCGINIIRIFRYAQDKKWQRLVILFKGMMAGLFFNPKIELVKKEDYE